MEYIGSGNFKVEETLLKRLLRLVYQISVIHCNIHRRPYFGNRLFVPRLNKKIYRGGFYLFIYLSLFLNPRSSNKTSMGVLRRQSLTPLTLFLHPSLVFSTTIGGTRSPRATSTPD